MFDKFNHSVRALCAADSDTESRMRKIKVLLEALVNDPSMREHSKAWPSTEGHENLVRTPGRDGMERLERYRRLTMAKGRTMR